MSLDAFKSAAKSTKAKAKNDKPELEIETLAEAIEKWLGAKTAEETAKATKAIAEEDILPAVLEKITVMSLDEGRPVTTVVLNGKLMCWIQDKYNKIPVEETPRLKEIFGAEFDTYFEDVMDISLTPAALSDPEIIKKLTAAVGAENINKYFDVDRYFKPRSGFHEDRLTKKVIKNKFDKALEEGIITTPKVSVKAK